MAIFEFSSQMPAPAEEVFDWHTRPRAIDREIPPWQRVRVVKPAILEAGSQAVLQVRVGGLWRTWVAEHRDVVPGRGFVDVLVRGPFARWEHTHTFTPIDAGGCTLTDRVTYELPLGLAGRLVAGRRVRRMLARTFAHRHRVLRDDLRRHWTAGARAGLTVAVTGASGLIGSRLVNFLSSGGHRVLRLTRRRATGADDEVFWDPAVPTASGLDAPALEGVDAVVHLAGEGIASGRWTAARKQRILDSRVNGTRLISETMARLDRPPRVLVSASAVGYYGDRGEELLDEQAESGSGFLAEVCRQWESAADPARDAGIRVVHPRIGLVVAGDGGAVGRMLTPFRFGLGGPIGGGRQYVSWIAMEDLVGAIYFAILNDTVAGAVNAVAPGAVPQRQFARTLGRVLRRPALAPLPTTAVKLMFGQMGRELLLGGARVRPGQLVANRFEFLYPNLEAALRAELGRPARAASGKGA